MNKNNSQFSKKFLGLLITVLIFISQAPLAFAAVKCEDLNEQKDPSLKGKILVITEEPFGSASGAGGSNDDGNNSTFRCARKTVCSLPPAADATAGAGNAAKQKRVCSPTYDQPDGCTPTTGQKLTDAMKATDGAYTICEMVQVYVADVGTNLLYLYIGQIYRYMAWFGGILAVFILIVAGFMMTTAGDNTEQVNKAKSLINRCITGLVVLFLSAAILYIINPNFFII